MQVIVVPNDHWTFGEVESFYDSGTSTVFVREQNSIIINEVPVESVEITDESELYNFVTPAKPEFSLEQYASSIIQETPIVYSAKESVDKIMNIKSLVEQDIEKENLEKQKETQKKIDEEQAKKDIENNIQTLAKNLDNYIGGFHTP